MLRAKKPTVKKTFQHMVQSRENAEDETGLASALLISAIDTQRNNKTANSNTSNNDEAYPVVGVTMTSTFLKISMW